jgi:hypothetical protein
LKNKQKGAKQTRREELLSEIDALGLNGNVRQLDEEGWTVIPDAMNPDLVRRLRARIMEVTDDQLQKKRRSGLKFAQLGSLLYHGREFEEAVQLPKQMALAEYMLGANYGVWQYLCSVRGEGTGGLPVHNDLGPGWREPFQQFPEMCTSLFILDEFNQDAGCTFIVPRTHHFARRPNIESADDRALVQKHAVPADAAPGSVLMWDARTWHGSLPRRIPGERVVCSYANSRPHFRSSDDYSELSTAVVERNPPNFRRMIGRGLGYGELGAKGGILFGGAKNGNYLSKHVKEEEGLSALDSRVRMRRSKEALGPAS